MAIEKYSDFVGYFRTLASEHVDLKDFVTGGAERILNRQNSNISYPVLWLEYPDISIRDGYLTRYQGAFLVLAAAPADAQDQEDENLDTCQSIIQDIIARMVDDADNGLFEFDMSGVSIQYKGNWGGDNDWGWRVEFALDGTACDCVDTEKWNL